LIALPRSDVADLVTELQSKGIKAATLVGYATALQEVSVRLV
jgi:hypothetical protein